MRAAIYARYSSDLQSEASIEDQVRLCHERAAREGHEVVEIFSDYAISGGHLNSRPGMLTLLERARAGDFETVLAEALDRLSRDQEDIAAIHKRLGHAGVTILTLAEGEINELHVGLKGTMNALYLKDLAQKTRRGLEGRVRQGKSGGGCCYGYDLVPGETGARHINASEAVVVRRIFRDYAAGRSPKSIALALNAERIPGPQGGAWDPSTINGNRERGTGILNNELYAGRLVWNRLTYRKDPETGKRISRLNPERDWVIEQVPDLRIVEDGHWQAVKERQQGLKAAKRGDGSGSGFWDRRRPRYLLSGLIKCGACGGGYAKISANLFGCSTHRNKGTCNNALNIRRDVLEATILEGLKSRLMAPELVKEFGDAFIAETNRLRRAAAGNRAHLEGERARVTKRIHTLVTAIGDGAAPKSLMAELHRLEARQAEIETELASAPTEPAPLIHPNVSAIYARKVAELHRLLEDPATKDEASAAIRALIDKVVLTPVTGELQIDLHGALAAILGLCQVSKKPTAEIRDGLEQVKVVAGARNHLKLTPLVLALSTWAANRNDMKWLTNA